MPGPNFSAPINFGSVVGAEKPNPILQLMQAIGAFPQQQEQSQEGKLQLEMAKQQKASNDIAMQSQELQNQSQQQTIAQNTQTMAKQGWDQIGNYLQSDPSAAKTPSPQLTARLRGIAQTMGVEPFNPDGSINTDLWKQSWNAVPQADQEAVLHVPPGPAREAMLAKYSNVPDSVHTQSTFFTPEQEAAIAHVNSETFEQLSLGNLHTIQGQTDLTMRGANLALAQARTNQANAAAYSSVSRANSAATEANAAVTRAQTEVYKATTGAMQAQAVKTYQEANKSLGDAESKYHGALQSLVQMEQANGIDPKASDAAQRLMQKVQGNSTEFSKAVTMMQTIQTTGNSIQQGKSTMQSIGAFLGTQPGWSTYVKSLSGARGVTVENANGSSATGGGAGKPPAAMLQKMPTGYTAEQRNGKWGIKDSTGKWYPWKGSP